MDIEGGLGQFTDLRMWGLGKKDGGGVFLGGLYPDAHYALKYPQKKLHSFIIHA